jgi:mRNA-degrading endonuclease RelE of RelBE toxin-antitoxin system
MVILETSVFTRRVDRLLDPESYRLLQLRLAADPESGTLIPGTGGLRKLRWQATGRGKRGGTRILYYWAPAPSVLLLLMIYRKNEADDLTPKQQKALRQIVEEEFG